MFFYELRTKARNAITLIGTRVLVGTTSEVTKYDFSDNFVSKNSRGEKHIWLKCVISGILRERFYTFKDDRFC